MKILLDSNVLLLYLCETAPVDEPNRSRWPVVMKMFEVLGNDVQFCV